MKGYQIDEIRYAKGTTIINAYMWVQRRGRGGKNCPYDLYVLNESLVGRLYGSIGHSFPNRPEIESQ